MDFKEIGINTRNWVDSAQNRYYWGALVNASLNLWVQWVIWLTLVLFKMMERQIGNTNSKLTQFSCIITYLTLVAESPVDHSPFASLLGPNIRIILRPKYSSQDPVFKYLILISSINVRNQVSQPYRATGNIAVLYISIFKFF